MSSGSGAEIILPFSSSDPNSLCTNVSYSCDSCGYELNLNSCNRNISAIDAKYDRSMRRGTIPFFSIDESRFAKINKVRWLPYLPSRKSWRPFKRHTRLLCKNCGNHIGTVMDGTCLPASRLAGPDHLATWDGITPRATYDMKIQSLRPLSSTHLIRSGSFS